MTTDQMLFHLTDDGCIVLIDRMTNMAYRVRVQHKARGYNEHTTSTGAPPIHGAYEKWQAWKAGQA